MIWMFSRQFSDKKTLYRLFAASWSLATTSYSGLLFIPPLLRTRCDVALKFSLVLVLPFMLLSTRVGGEQKQKAQ